MRQMGISQKFQGVGQVRWLHLRQLALTLASMPNDKFRWLSVRCLDGWNENVLNLRNLGSILIKNLWEISKEISFKRKFPFLPRSSCRWRLPDVTEPNWMEMETETVGNFSRWFHKSSERPEKNEKHEETPLGALLVTMKKCYFEPLEQWRTHHMKGWIIYSLINVKC